MVSILEKNLYPKNFKNILQDSWNIKRKKIYLKKFFIFKKTGFKEGVYHINHMRND